MRVRIESLRLIGTARDIEFRPGLNVIIGPIASGKTTVLRLCRFLLGSTTFDFIREVKEKTSGVAGTVTLGEDQYSIVRALVSTADASVEIAGPNTSLRLPAYRATDGSPTYGDWLLDKLDLPRLRVPRAPTQPESPPTAVTINDYLLYCHLAQNEIDDSVFGHHDPFKNIKRKYVFDILYGRFGIEMAQLYQELRELDPQIRALRADRATLERVLSETPWENRAELERILAQAQQEVQEASQSLIAVADSAPAEASDLRSRLRDLDESTAANLDDLQKETASRERLEALIGQLHTQSARLTRSIVADELLLDFEFLKCPRCAATIEDSREEDGRCPLCLQEPEPSVTRDDLLGEQKRIGTQISETRELVDAHNERARDLERLIEQSSPKRTELVAELDFRTRSYVSDAGEALALSSERRASAQERVARLKDYLGLFARLDHAAIDAGALEQRKEELEMQLEGQRQAPSHFAESVRQLTSEFALLLERFSVPRFPGVTEPSTIDLRNYQPVLYGRRFDELSSQGLMVLVNVAHALAHQRTAITRGLLLPNILFIDGLTSNIGHEDLDQERVEAIYRYLIGLSEELGERLQVIVADNDVPAFAQEYITLRLSEDDRLVPMPAGQS